MTKYCFVLDADGKPLSPTKEVKGWYMIRIGKAKLVCKYPMTIQLKRSIPDDDICKDEVRCGIDDGSLYIGVGLIQNCKTKNKVIFKAIIELRNDVKKRMDSRRAYRRHRRYYKRYRPIRFENRASSKRIGRIAPSILQKRQTLIRFLIKLQRIVVVSNYWLEDVAIDIRVLTDGYKPYRWQYQKSNRLDENLRRAAIMRDDYKCQECGRTGCRLEVHHIKPRRLNGSNTLKNLITLCKHCHQKTEGVEERYMQHYFDILQSSDNIRFNYAQHVMVGKTWLRNQISALGELHLTTGGDTSNKRENWNIEKSHSNDALCITGLQPDTCDINAWVIKPIRKRTQAHTFEVSGFRHRDYVEYTYTNGSVFRGYVTALYPELNKLNFKSPTRYCNKALIKNCKLLWRFTNFYWISDVA